jgi:4a-hydroxytetrahydrobiopterin dehydratase
MAKLSEQDVQAALQDLPGWAVTNGALTKTYTLAGFPDAIALVNGAAERAEAVGHHPDIDIRYNRVTFALVTHDQGGITEKDVAMARDIEAQSSFPERQDGATEL